MNIGTEGPNGTEERQFIKEKASKGNDDPKIMRVKYIAEFLLINDIYKYLNNEFLLENLQIYKERGPSIFDIAAAVSPESPGGLNPIDSPRKEKSDENSQGKPRSTLNRLNPSSGLPLNKSDDMNRGRGRKKSFMKDQVEEPPKVSPKFTFKENISKFVSGFENICNEYLMISLVLSNIKKMNTHFLKLTEFYAETLKELKTHVGSILIFSNQDFLEKVMHSILKYGERLIFTEVLSRIDDLDILVSDNAFSSYVKFHRYDRLLEFYTRYNKVLETNMENKDDMISRMDSLMDDRGSIETTKKKSEQQVNKEKVVLLVKNYFIASDDDRLIMKILYNMKKKRREILEILLETREQERTMKILRREESIFACIKIELLLRMKLYKLFILFDKMELINIFNQPIRQNSNISVYHKICLMIEKGESVEPLCIIVIHVSETFWDSDKLMRFFLSLNKVLRNPNTNWLVYIQNPPLFCMTLSYFFKKMKNQLDYRGNEIHDLSSGMLNFCTSYVENASEEALKLNLFEKDNNGLTFLDYAFRVGEMSVLETEQVEGLVKTMWDLQRHTYQTLDEFMRVNTIIDYPIQDLSILKYNYMTPIEEDDCFQLEFRFTSNSVFLKTLAEILWLIPIIILEFIFSMNIIQMRLRNEFNTHWLSNYISQNTAFFYVLVFFRLSFVLSSMVSALAINTITSDNQHMFKFYNLFIFMTLFQIGVYPIFLWDSFWAINISEMIFDCLLVTYMMFNILSLNDFGVTLRIFARMSYVVLIFGSVSCLAITIIAYPIHTIFINFTQQVEGQIYTDLNLFSNLYQGILTCFEFVFGAVVLVRPYQEQNFYTYSMTFIMMMFSFFGNIMLANLLVAFLTNQFDEINQNAKYLTMNMQFGLIKVFGKSDTDTLVSTPYIIIIPSLFLYIPMVKKAYRERVNKFMRKVIHVINVFIPVMLLMSFKQFGQSILRYFQILMKYFVLIFTKPKGIFYFFVWLFLGMFVMLKLMIYDYKTIIEIVLSFEAEECDILNNELSENTRKNLVSIFSKFYKVINQQLAVSKDKFVTYKHFLDQFHAFSNQQQIILKKVTKGLINYGVVFADKSGEEEEAEQLVHPGQFKISPIAVTPVPKSERQLPAADQEREGEIGRDINANYTQDEKTLAPLLLKKFAYPSNNRNESLDNYRINLEFMRDKLKNNINEEGVLRLIAFEKNILDIASKFLQPSNDQVIQREFREVREGIVNLEDKIKRLVEVIMTTKQNFINK